MCLLIVVGLHLFWFFLPFFFSYVIILSLFQGLPKQSVLEAQLHVCPFDSECSSFNFTLPISISQGRRKEKNPYFLIF